MRFKILFISTLLLVTSFTAWCQDKIYKRDGSTMKVIVKEVGTKNVTYKKYDNPDGPLYTVQNSEIEKIVYQNGSEDTFDIADDADRRPSFADRREEAAQKREDAREKGRHKKKIYYKPNIISIAPLQISENGVGFGLSYERMLDKSGIVSVYIPTYLTFNTNTNNYNYNTGNYNTTNNDPTFYAAPGIKIYPTGSQGKVKYSVGPSLVVASGTETYGDNSYINNNNNFYYGEQLSHFMMGVMVVNSLNVNPTPRLYMGLELGLGMTYVNRVEGTTQETTGLVEFSFRMGYRF